MDWQTVLFAYGPLGAFAVFVCTAVWKLGGRYAERVVINWERYVTINRDFIETLKANDQSHHDTCREAHSRAMRTTGQNREAIDLWCGLCREVAALEFPNIAQIVDKHCDEIQRVIRDSNEVT